MSEQPGVAEPRPRGSTAYVVGRMGRLVRKEVVSILRDRRTVITLIMMPLLLYPLLSIAFQQFMLSQATDATERIEYSLGFVSQEEAQIVGEHLELGRRVLQERKPETVSDQDRAKPRDRTIALKSGQADADHLPLLVREGQVHLAVRLVGLADRRWQRGADQALYCELLYLETSPASLEAKQYVERLLSAANEQLLFTRLGLPVRRPVRQISPVEAPLRPLGGAPVVPIKALVPLILILMTITGAVYPAIDLTAGERERGTLEVLVAAPVPRLGLLFAKYVSVLTVAVLTAIVNLVVMTATVQVTGLGRLVFGEAGLTAGVVLQVFFLLLLFAAFFSAVLLAVTSFARSFKEAQAYLIPLVLVSLMPGLLSVLPGLQLDGGLVVAPLMNIVLLARDVLDGTARLGVAVQVVLATVVYAVAAVALAARVFGAEAVLYNEQGTWSDLVRRPSRPRPAASVSAALLCLALMFPAFFVASYSLRDLAMQSMSASLIVQALVTLFLCGLLPLGSAWLGRVRTASGFRLERAAVGAWGPAVLLGLCLWPLALEVFHLLQTWGVGTLTETQHNEVDLRLRLLQTVPLALVVLCLGALPALCEEFFFRGYLLSALLRAASPRSAIVGSALFFGAFHLLGRGLVQVESGVISTLLGLVLGWLCWRTGSLVPGMIVHVLHNSLLTAQLYLKPWLIEQGWITREQQRLPLVWTAGAALVCVVAALWVAAWSRPQASLAPPEP